MPILPDLSNGLTSPVFAITEDIAPLPPRTLSIGVAGFPREKEILRAVIEYEGGVEGNSLYRWYRCSSSPRPVCVQDTDVNLPYYQLTWEDVGSLIKVEYIPVRASDGAQGKVSTAWTTEIAPITPEITKISILGKLVEGEVLQGQGVYQGEGPEGKSLYKWYRTDPQEPTGYHLIANNTLTYTCSLQDIGHNLMFEIVPVDQRNVSGKTASTTTKQVQAGYPKIEKLSLIGQLEESFPITVVGKYFGGIEGNSIIQWYRTDPSAEENPQEPQPIQSANTVTYIPSADDIGCFLLVSYTPVRSDGASGNKETIMTGQPIIATQPAIEQLSILGDLVEGNELIATYVYKGGEEGKSQFFWSRGDGKSFTPIPSSEGKRAYFPVHEDVGYCLKFTYTPMRKDGEIGSTQQYVSSKTIAPAFPSVTSVGLAILDPEAEFPTFEGHGRYVGGKEGESVFVWQKLRPDGIVENIEGYNMQYYTTSEKDKNSCIRFGYRPVRSDGVSGQMVFSEYSAPVNSPPPKITNYSIQGNLIEGETISFYANYRYCEPTACSYTWFRRNSRDLPFLPIAGASDLQYKISIFDVGFEMKCEVEPKDKSGRVGAKVEAVTTTIIEPALPKVVSLKIIGAPYHNTRYRAIMQYYGSSQCIYLLMCKGGKEGKSLYLWFKLHDHQSKEENWIPIKGVHDVYQATINDMGAKIRVLCTPIRDDGVQGKPFACDTEVLKIAPSLATQINAHLFAGEAEFKVIKKGKLNNQILQLLKDGIKLRDNDTLILKEEYSPQLKVFTDGSSTDGFSVTVERQNGKQVLLHVDSQDERDTLIATLRCFCDKYVQQQQQQ